MKKASALLLLLVLASPLFSVQLQELSQIINTKVATKGDAVFLTACLKDSSLKRKQVKGADSDKALSYGELAKVILEGTGLHGVWLYELLHWQRYAFASAVEKGWMNEDYSANRQVSGLELVSIIGKVKQEGSK